MTAPEPLSVRIDRLWNFGDPAATETRFREVLERADFAPGTAARAELLTQIGRAQGLQRRFDEALATLEEAAGQAAALGEAGRVAAIRHRLERGRTLNSSRRDDRGRADFLAALDLARAAGEDNLAVDAAHMMGIIEPPDAAIEWNRRALDMAEASASERARNWIGALTNNLGWALHDRGDHAAALAVFEKALAWRRAKAQPAETRIAAWCVAKMHRLLGRLDEALAAQRALEAEWRDAGQPDGYVLEELGECLLALGRASEAAPWFARAHAELSKDDWLRAQEPARLERLRSLGGA